jgi:hypothetical protein
MFSVQSNQPQPQNKIMKTRMPSLIQTRTVLAMVVALTFLAAPAARAQTAEAFQQMKEMMEKMQQTIDAQNARIAALEKAAAATNAQPATAPAVAPPVAPPVTAQEREISNSPSIMDLEKVAAGGQIGEQSQVTWRHALNDQQEAASRPKDYTLDPTYQGFIPVPNTPVLIQFNAKPHLDMISDNMYAGNENRFVPAMFPLQGAANYGGGEQFTMTANATQLRLDARAPDMPGDFRFYYQNDFFGSGSDTGDMKYRLQHLYGQLYGFKAGFTYSAWEDPDSWPDTVDYEGPNAVIFARRPVAQYTYAWSDHWNSTIGVEKPDIYIDTDSGPNPGGTTMTKMPDFAFNTRYEKAGFGHLQFSSIFRDIGVKDTLGNDQQVFAWGVNTSANFDLTKKDYLQLLGAYGHGVGGLGNDTSFLNSDAAFTDTGSLQAMPYWSASAGYTHRWCDSFRSTFTYGYVNLDNTSGEMGTFYHTSHYASANIIWQIRKRLSIGLEGLYGLKTASDGNNSGNHWRVQLGMVYSLFD